MLRLEISAQRSFRFSLKMTTDWKMSSDSFSATACLSQRARQCVKACFSLSVSLLSLGCNIRASWHQSTSLPLKEHVSWYHAEAQKDLCQAIALHVVVEHFPILYILPAFSPRSFFWIYSHFFLPPNLYPLWVATTSFSNISCLIFLHDPRLRITPPKY